jgi:hypothetical protein
MHTGVCLGHRSLVESTQAIERRPESMLDLGFVIDEDEARVPVTISKLSVEQSGVV